MTMKYWLEHEKIIQQALSNKKGRIDWPRLQQKHLAKTKLLQHERLIHLLVTLSFGSFSLLSFFAFLLLDRIEIVIPAIVFLVTTLVYVIHYYRLENATLRWYKLTDKLADKLK